MPNPFALVGRSLIITQGTRGLPGSGGVSKFNGRTGDVVPATDDYSLAQINGLAAALAAKQPLNPNLTSFSALTLAADLLPYSKASETMTTTPLTAFARSILDDVDAAAVRNTLGLVIGTDVQGYSANLASIAAASTTAFGISLLTISGANDQVLITDGAGVPQMSATLPAVSGVNVTSLNASNLSSGTVPDARLSGNVPIMVGGLIQTSNLPALAITEVYVVASEAAMLALTAQRGDVAKRTDIGRTFILSTDSPGTLADWIEVTAGDVVSSVNGQVGVVVLGASDVGAQPEDDTLSALAGITVAADQLIYATGADSFAVTGFSSVARTLVAQTTQALMRSTGLGATTVGSALFTLTNPSAIRFIRINADNSVSALDSTAFATAIGLGTGNSVTHSTLRLGAYMELFGNSGVSPAVRIRAQQTNVPVATDVITIFTPNAGGQEIVLTLNNNLTVNSASLISGTATGNNTGDQDLSAYLKATGALNLNNSLIEANITGDVDFRINDTKEFKITGSSGPPYYYYSYDCATFPGSKYGRVTLSRNTTISPNQSTYPTLEVGSNGTGGHISILASAQSGDISLECVNYAGNPVIQVGDYYGLKVSGPTTISGQLRIDSSGPSYYGGTPTTPTGVSIGFFGMGGGLIGYAPLFTT